MRRYLLLTLVLAGVLAVSGCVSRNSSNLTQPSADCGRTDKVYNVEMTPPPGSTLHENDDLVITWEAEARSSSGTGLAYIRDDGESYLPGVGPVFGCPSSDGEENTLVPRNGVYILGRGGHRVNVEVIFAPPDLGRSLTWADVTFRYPIPSNFLIE